MKRSAVFGMLPADSQTRSPTLLAAAGIVSLIAYFVLQVISSEKPLRYSDEMMTAARTMQRATAVTRAYCDSAGIEINTVDDPNRTCLIGPEAAGLMTTLGHLDAKRTTTDPAMASLLVYLLDRAGVSAGERIAIGSSGSFPALLVATLAAAEAMGVHAVPIISLGSSTYGATNPHFNLLDIYTLLLEEDVIVTPPAAVSLGGAQDVGNDFESDLNADMLARFEESGIPVITEPELRKNVAARMAVYDGTAADGPVSAFVNAGGSYANVGTSSLALRLEPGLNTDITVPPEEERGVVFEMAARGVPVIHLLFIRGLAQRYGLSWDPIPLGEPGDTPLHADRARSSRSVWFVGVPYFVVIGLLIAVYSRSAGRRPAQAPTSHPAAEHLRRGAG